MPRLPALPDNALRLYGRIDRFTVECPRCATLIRAAFKNIAQTRRQEAKKTRPSAKDPGNPTVAVFNPLTQRLTCPQCRRVFAVGLLLYPVASRMNPGQPYDTAPTWKQLLEERQLCSAFILQQPIKGAASVNILVESACSCEGRALAPSCPVHGWSEQLSPNGRTTEQAALEAEIARLREENLRLKNPPG